MNKLQWIGIGGLALILFGGGLYLGNWLNADTLEELTEHNNRLAERAEVQEHTIGEMQRAFSKITFDYTQSRELVQALKERNFALANFINEQEAELTSLAQANAELRETLSGVDVVEETDTTYTVVIDKEKIYARGRISVEGTTTLPKLHPDSAQTVLDVSVRTSPILAWERMETGESRLIIDYGDMPITVDSIFGAQNVNDPILDKAREPFWSMVGKISGGVIGVGLAVGIAALIL